jgi:hypothetical protein
VLYVNPGAVLYVNPGAVLYVNPGTVLYVIPGTVLYVNPGAVLYVNPGAVLHVAAGTFNALMAGIIAQLENDDKEGTLAFRCVWLVPGLCLGSAFNSGCAEHGRSHPPLAVSLLT